MNEWKERDRYAYVFVATCAYITSLFLAWWNVTMTGDSQSPARAMRVDGLGSGFGSTNRLSELCVVSAVAMLILTVLAMRSSDRRFLLVLRHLAMALVIFNALSVLELWRSAEFYRGSHIAYGAYVAIGTSLLLLFSVLALEAGGMRKLLSRRKNSPERVSGA